MSRRESSTNRATQPREYEPGRFLNLLLLGDSGVGKTSLMFRYANMEKEPPRTLIRTCGVDFKEKEIEVRGEAVNVRIWDTAGGDRFWWIVLSYFRLAHGMLLLIDCAYEDFATSARMVDSYMRAIQEKASPNIPVTLVACKCENDDARPRRWSSEQGQELAKQHGMRYCELSARTGIGVVEAFELTTTDVVYKSSAAKAARAEAAANAKAYEILVLGINSARQDDDAASLLWKLKGCGGLYKRLIGEFLMDFVNLRSAGELQPANRARPSRSKMGRCAVS